MVPLSMHSCLTIELVLLQCHYVRVSRLEYTSLYTDEVRDTTGSGGDQEVIILLADDRLNTASFCYNVIAYRLF